MTLTIELLGLPRRRAGWSRADLTIAADRCTLSDVVERLITDTPALREQLVSVDGQLRHVLANVNGRRFVRALDEPLHDSDTLLFMSADAGG